MRRRAAVTACAALVAPWSVSAQESAQESPQPAPAARDAAQPADPAPEGAPPPASERPWAPVDVTPPGVPGPKKLGFNFRKRNHTGVGVTVGTDALGLVVTSMLTDRDALQLSFGVANGTYAYWSRAGAWLSADYLQHPPLILSTPHLGLAWQIGFGVSARIGGRPADLEAAIGVCGIGSLQLLLTDVPIDLTLAYRPAVLVTFTRPAGLAFAYGDIAAQARWWF